MFASAMRSSRRGRWRAWVCGRSSPPRCRTHHELRRLPRREGRPPANGRAGTCRLSVFSRFRLPIVVSRTTRRSGASGISAPCGHPSPGCEPAHTGWSADYAPNCCFSARRPVCLDCGGTRRSPCRARCRWARHGPRRARCGDRDRAASTRRPFRAVSRPRPYEPRPVTPRAFDAFVEATRQNLSFAPKGDAGPSTALWSKRDDVVVANASGPPIVGSLLVAANSTRRVNVRGRSASRVR